MAKRVANRLVALSSAAVLWIYSAGYLRTRAAAERLQASERTRVVVPEQTGLSEPVTVVATPLKATAPAPSDVPAKPRKTPPPAAGTAATTPVAAPIETPVTVATTPTPLPAVSPVPVTADPVPAPTPPAPQYKDGTYSGWGTSRHGDIEVTVVVAAGRITSAVISQCYTRYSCSVVAHLQGQVVERQSAEVDYVSRATQSANAFYYGVLQALSKAK